MNEQDKQTLEKALELCSKRLASMREMIDTRKDFDDHQELETLYWTYRAGQKNEFPVFLKPFIIEARKQLDPDYELYLELKKKFGA